MAAVIATRRGRSALDSRDSAAGALSTICDQAFTAVPPGSAVDRFERL